MRAFANSIIRTSALASALAMGCTGSFDAGPPRPPRPAPMEPAVQCEAAGMDPRTDAIRHGLERNCIGCHQTGDYGYFASAAAFESLLVRNPRFVVPGDPEGSALVQLLEGRRTGSSLTQMPLSGDTFSVLAERGETDISMAEIRTWITELTLPGTTTQPSAEAATVQRLSATHFELGVTSILGLTPDDFFRFQYEGNDETNALRIGLRDPDSFAIRSPDRVADVEGPNRYLALGGGSAALQRVEDRSPSTAFVQTLVPLSQAWCQRAVNKTGNTALFTIANASTTSTDLENVRAQIADWHLVLLAQPATSADIDHVMNDVFLPLESESSATNAWVGTCAYFVRHPLFVLY